MQDNKILLAIIAVAAVGILGVMIYQANKQTPEEKMAESIAAAMNDISAAAGAAATGEEN